MSIDTKSSFESLSSSDFSHVRIAIVQSRYHSDITDRLKDAAIETLKQYGVQHIFLIEVSGGYELVYGSQRAAQSIEHLDGVIVLGCVIKGDTDHDIYINHAVAQGLIHIQSQFDIPVGFGLLTTNNLQQAQDRAGGSLGNKGQEVALAVLNAIDLQIKKV